MDNQLKSRHLLVLIISFQFIFFPSASVTRDFHSRGEPREAIVAQSMFSQGNLILPQGYADVVPSKPPLFHWLTALFSVPSGKVTEFSARLPSVLAACLIALLSFYLFAPESSKAVALLATLILASSNEWLRTASSARVDMLLTATLMLAFFALYRWSQRAFSGYPWLFLASLTLAVLCKGPVGVVLPALIYLTVCLSDKISIWQICKRALIVFVPALLLASIWYAAAYFSRPQEFLDKVYYENVARFLSMQEEEPHKASAIKLYAMLLLGFLPWTILVLALIIKKIRLKQLRFTFPSLIYLKIWWKTRSKIDTFAIIVVVVTLLFYAIPKGKRSAYILPVHPFIAFWLARFFLEEAKQLSSKLFIKAAYIVASLTIVLLITLTLFLITPSFTLLTKFPASLNPVILETQQSVREFILSSLPVFGSIILIAFFVLGLSLSLILRAKKESGLPWFLGSTFSLYFVLQLIVVPAIVNPISPKVFAQQICAVVPESTQLLSFGEEFYGLSFYSGRKFLRAEQSGFPNAAVVVVAADDLARLQEALPAKVSLELIEWSNKSVMKTGKHLGLFKIVS